MMMIAVCCVLVALVSIGATVAFVTPFVLSSASITRRSSSTTAFAGPTLVDLDQYNLPVHETAQEWTANLRAATAMLDEGAYLGARNSKEIFVDTVKVAFRRGQGLGLELLEIAGGRVDGLGITVVSGIIEGGSAENSGVQIGDSIVQIGIRTLTKGTISSGGFTETQEEVSVETECLGYDATIEAIGSLPAKESNDEVVVLTVKRLRRKPKVMVKLQYPPSQQEDDITIELFSGENLRRAMLTRGVKLNDPLSRRFDSGGEGSCGGEATCTTCVVGVQKGMELLNPQSIQEGQMLVKNSRWRLGCKAIVGHQMQEGEMTIRVNPRQWIDK